MTSPEITSLLNPRVKAAVALRNRRDRDRTGLTIVDGGRECLRALDAEVELELAFVCPELIRASDAREAARRVAAHGARVIHVAPNILEKVAYGERSDGIVLIVRVPPMTLDAIELPADPFVAVVEGLEKPGNLGAIIRSADGAGVDAVVAAEPLTDLFNPNAIRASVGAIFSIPLAAAATATVVAWLAHSGLTTFAARVDAARPYTDVDFTGAVAVVLGSEAIGLGEAWRAAGIEPIRLPMLGTADSLNVSTTAAVLFYEARRQRDAKAARAAAIRPVAKAGQPDTNAAAPRDA